MNGGGSVVKSPLLYRHLHKVDHVANGWRLPLGSLFPVLCVYSCPRCIAGMVAVVVGRGRVGRGRGLLRVVV